MDSRSTPAPGRSSTGTASSTPPTASLGTTGRGRSPAVPSARTTSTDQWLVELGALNPLFGIDVGLSSNNTWVYSDVNGNNSAGISELIRADATSNFNYAFFAVQQHDQLAVLRGVSVLLELALPGRGVLLADESPAERDAGLLLRQHLPRPPEGGADRLHGCGPQLRVHGRDGGAGLGGDPVNAESDDAARPGRRLQQRELRHAAGRQPAADADVPVHPDPEIRSR